MASPNSLSSNQLFLSEDKVRNLLIGLGIILIVLAGYFYFTSQKTEETSSLSPEEIIVQEEGTVKKTGEMTEPLTEEEVRKMREEIDSVLSTAGETADLKDVVGEQANGQAQRAFSDGKFYYKLTAFNLRPSAKGYYYQSWLEKNGQYLSTGRVEVGADNQGIVYYSSSTDRSDYSRALITLEPEDGNPAPATTVLEGSFSNY